jgi:hypothetical protein
MRIATGAVVEAPAVVERHEGVHHEAAVAVGVRREQQHAVGGAALQPGDGVLQRLAGCFRRAGEDVLAIAVEHAHVQVQAAAGLPGEGLGHEAGDHALAPGHALDDALEVDRLVAGAQRVVAMLQIDFELPGAYSATAVSAGTPCTRQASATASVKRR